MPRKLVDPSNRNLRTAFEKLADHSPSGERRQFGSVRLAFSGIPVPIYNRAFVFEDPSPDQLKSAVSWLTQQDVPFWVTVPDSVKNEVDGIFSDMDLAKAERVDPGMAIEIPDSIPANETAVEIDTVADEEELADIARISATVFDTPLELAEQAYQPTLLADDQIEVLVGRVDGQSVASGLMVRSMDVVGVYTIGVLDEFRRRGIGEAMTWEVLRLGRDVGCDIGVLQSSEMAYSLYKKMGFETIVEYHHYGQFS